MMVPGNDAVLEKLKDAAGGFVQVGVDVNECRGSRVLFQPAGERIGEEAWVKNDVAGHFGQGSVGIESKSNPRSMSPARPRNCRSRGPFALEIRLERR